jgi:hypothetical protein
MVCCIVCCIGSGDALKLDTLLLDTLLLDTALTRLLLAVAARIALPDSMRLGDCGDVNAPLLPVDM